MIKPYYSEPNIQIYNGDCLEVLSNSYSDTYDLILASPPYGDLREYDNLPFYDFRKIAWQLFRGLKNGGCLVWVVADQTINGSESGESFKQALYFKEVGFNLHDTMIYAKNNWVPLTHNRFEQSFEYMFVFSKGKPKTFNPILMKCSNYGRSKSMNYRCGTTEENASFRSGMNRTVRVKETKIKNNIWSYDIGANKTAKDSYIMQHPAVFPEKLAMDHINSWSNPGDTILDPFLGSGTTARACKDLNRKCIGIEINQKYCDIAIKRLGQEVFNFND
jgi:site-specific DNA-methyltransferase (adenine-specific)